MYFNGECSENEINRLLGEFKIKGSDVVIGVWGSEIHNTVKAIGYYEKALVVIMPTIASTDAPCIAVSVIFTDYGIVKEYLLVPKNPNIVTVDVWVVANAHSRLLVAGMGDYPCYLFQIKSLSKIWY